MNLLSKIAVSVERRIKELGEKQNYIKTKKTKIVSEKQKSGISERVI